MNARDLTALVHLVGFATGIVLYAMLGVMTRRRLAYVDTPVESRRADRVLVAAALLGIVWNVGAMVAYAVRDFGIGSPLPWLGALSYTALGFLPAVVVHATINRSTDDLRRWLVRVAYAGSAVAGLLHMRAAWRGDMLSPVGLLLLTVTYAIVLGVLGITERTRPGFQRSITAVALAAFAVSAVHLSRHPGLVDQGSWPMELIGHHGSLPLVLALLYQDYRFAFADLFLKRALSLLSVVGIVVLLYVTIAAPLVDPHAIAARQAANDGSHLATTAALLTLWVATALAYPFVQQGVFRFVDRVILHRADYRERRTDLARRLASNASVEDALQSACQLLGETLNASVSWHSTDAPADTGQATIVVESRGAGARILVPTAITPSFGLRIGELRDGRTLLSDDLVFIDAAAAAIGRRIDEIRFDEERAQRREHDREVRRLATEAELRALRAQLNPHFLFNALNTLGHLMKASPDRAIATLYRLTGLMRAVLRRTNGEFVTLGDELEIVEPYLAIERERFEERLVVSIDVPQDLREARVPPLLLQPLVENAVKHGIAPLRRGGLVTVRAERDIAPGEDDGYLRLTVIDTGCGMTPASEADGTGVGLANIKSRLQHYYGPSAMLTMRPTEGGGTTVEVCLPWMSADHAALASTH